MSYCFGEEMGKLKQSLRFRFVTFLLDSADGVIVVVAVGNVF